MSSPEEPLAHRPDDLLKGAGIGICSVLVSALCGWGGVVVLFFSYYGAEPGPSTHELVGLTAMEADALSPYLMLVFGLIVAAVIGRVFLGRRRSAVSVAAGLIFTTVTTLGVAFSPVTRTEWATGLAAVASAGLWGAAFLRPAQGAEDTK